MFERELRYICLHSLARYSIVTNKKHFLNYRVQATSFRDEDTSVGVYCNPYVNNFNCRV